MKRGLPVFGLLLIICSLTVVSALITNPSFEEGTGMDATGWTQPIPNSMRSTNRSTEWSSEGSYSMQGYLKTNNPPGPLATSVTQDFDSLESITFDSNLIECYGVGTCDLRVCVDTMANCPWSQSTTGILTDQTIDLSSYPGAHQLILLYYSFHPNPGQLKGVKGYFDNFRYVAAPIVPRSGPESDIILTISSSINAHGELHNEAIYPTGIYYSDIFGVQYDGIPTRSFVGGSGAERPFPNWVLSLSSSTNGHAESPNLASTYPDTVNYGDLSCASWDGDCSGLNIDVSHDFRCVVELSSESNAHLAECGTGYPRKICCTSPSAGAVDCEALTTNTSCLANPCTWTPPRELAPKGGCCDYQEQWDDFSGTCILESAGNLCYTLFDRITKSPSSFNFGSTPVQYCAKISNDLSYGFWYDAETY